MKHAPTPALAREVEDFKLAFTCERCAHFDPASGGCASGYPNDEHREGRLAAGAPLVFCKEFELA